MRLISLEIEPNGKNGWHFPKTDFGYSITQLFGPNGSGKTPTIQFIVYAMGLPVIFREIIYDKCKAVILRCEIADKEYSFVRQIQKEFSASIFSNGNEIRFNSEAKFSEYCLTKIEFSFPNLVGISGTVANPYMATLLPITYLNQDTGYSRFYSPHSTFIRDQFEEMVRVYFELPPKNNFDSKKRALELKSLIESCNSSIVFVKESLERLKADVAAYDEKEIVNLSRVYIGEMESIRTIKDSRVETVGALHRTVADQRGAIHSIIRELNLLESRIQGTERIEKEIEAEIETLSLNVEARNVFMSFKEICSNPSCGLFKNSADNYGKSLLYLKDQLKDLQVGKSQWRFEITALLEKKRLIEAETVSIENHLSKSKDTPEISTMVEAIRTITTKIYDLEQAKRKIEIFNAEKGKLFDLLTKRDKLSDELADTSRSTSEPSIRVSEIRQFFKECIVKWLDLLETKNVSRDISLDSSFYPVFGTEKIDQFHGSTRVRLVLSFHAALLEAHTRFCPGNPLPFILDTPRQQEIETSHLKTFITGISELSKISGLQVIFSTTEFRFDCGPDDAEWTPMFIGREQNMYLGTLADYLLFQADSILSWWVQNFISTDEIDKKEKDSERSEKPLVSPDKEIRKVYSYAKDSEILKAIEKIELKSKRWVSKELIE
jgi:hypothetical protein